MSDGVFPNLADMFLPAPSDLAESAAGGNLIARSLRVPVPPSVRGRVAVPDGEGAGWCAGMPDIAPSDVR